MRLRNAWWSVALLALAASAPRVARANGLELLPGGTQSVSRGGAVAARPENGMALEQNPAGLALLPGGMFTLNVDYAMQDMCEDPYGYYGWGTYQVGASEFAADPLKLEGSTHPEIDATYATTRLPRVCNSGRSVPVPNIAWVFKLGRDLALSAGFVAPTVVTGLQFGGADGTISVKVGDQVRGFPTPTRYQLIRQEVKFALVPSAGFGYRLLSWLQVGAMLQVGMLRAESRAIVNGASGTQPSTDWLTDLDAHDYFVPSVTASVNATPLPQLDLMAAFRWVDNFDGSGTVTYTTNTFHEGATSGPIPFKNDAIKLDQVEVKAPWTLTVGARYAGLLADADSAERRGPGDPMDRELWDIEVDSAYNFNRRASESAVRAGEDVTLISREVGGGGDTQSYQDLETIRLDHHGRDSIVVRLGGSFSVVPRRVALDAGAFYETRGVDPAYANIDSFSFARLGLGLGGVVRVGAFDIMAGYGHIFEETVDVAPPPHELLQKSVPGDPTSGFDQRVGVDDNDPSGGVVLRDPSAPSPARADAVAKLQQSAAISTKARPARVVNAGKYTASFDVLSAGLVYHF